MSNYTLPEFVMEGVFNKEICSDGRVFFWRDCVLTDDMSRGEQGYMVYWPALGQHKIAFLHTYRYPPDWAKY